MASKRVTIDPVAWGWGLAGLLALSAVITYSRLPAGELYNVRGHGIGLGLSRAIVLFGYPVALVAPPLAAVAWSVACSRGRAWVLAAGTALCATAMLPGVVDSGHLNARPVNAAATIGVAVCLALTVASRRHAMPRPLLDLPRTPVLIGAVVLILLALPWIGAQAGFYVGDIPGIGRLYMSKRVMPEPGHPTIRAVHLGNHEGLDGIFLALTALLLLAIVCEVGPRALRTALTAYLSLLLWYGAAVFANDFWGEQVVKRGWTATGIPSALQPAINITWLVVLVAAGVTFAAMLRAGPVKQNGRGP
jgi:hypothetical protein